MKKESKSRASKTTPARARDQHTIGARHDAKFAMIDRTEIATDAGTRR
jgi:hypothetical protein